MAPRVLRPSTSAGPSARGGSPRRLRSSEPSVSARGGLVPGAPLQVAAAMPGTLLASPVAQHRGIQGSPLRGVIPPSAHAPYANPSMLPLSQSVGAMPRPAYAAPASHAAHACPTVTAPPTPLSASRRSPWAEMRMPSPLQQHRALPAALPAVPAEPVAMAPPIPSPQRFPPRSALRLSYRACRQECMPAYRCPRPSRLRPHSRERRARSAR